MKLTLREFYYGDEYHVVGETFRDYWEHPEDRTDTATQILLLTVKHTVLATLKLVKNRDCISELESEMQSFFMGE